MKTTVRTMPEAITSETASLAAARAEVLVEIRRLERLKDPKVSQMNRLAWLRTIPVL